MKYHSSIVRESRAYVVQAQLRRELGIPPKAAFHQAVQAAPSEYEAYAIAWQEMVRTSRLDQFVPQRDVPIAYMPGNSAADPV